MTPPRPATDPGQISALDPPPEGEFDSAQQVLDYVQNWALSHGYCVVKASSNPGLNMTIRCKHSDTPKRRTTPSTVPHPRNRPSMRTGCPFSLYAKCPKQLKYGVGKSTKWQLRVRDPNHNHEFKDPLLYHEARHFTEAEIAKITELIALPQREIWQILEEERQGPVLRGDLKNQIARIKKGKITATGWNLQSRNPEIGVQQGTPMDTCDVIDLRSPSPESNVPMAP